jgi:DNA invertase Pin-like site-specific DNA recombinase
VTLIAASSPMHFIEDTPTARLVRQVLGAIAEFEKTTLVAKLAAARRRKRASGYMNWPASGVSRASTLP